MRNSLHRAILALAAGCLTTTLMLGGAAPAWALQDPGKPAPTTDSGTSTYRIQVRDELSVSVTPQKEYDCDGVVLDDGMLTLKNIGRVKAAGLTLDELQKEITKLLEAELVDPRVIVAISKVAPEISQGRVTVTGGVERGGLVELQPGMRLRKAIDLVGGPSRDADLSKVVVIHKDLTRTVVDLSAPDAVVMEAHNVLLRDGDSVEVPTLAPRGRATIIGAVERGGPLELEPGLRLWKAIALSGGPSREADLSKVRVVHKDQTVTLVNLSGDPAALQDRDNLLLKDGDSVEVPLRFESGVVAITGAVGTPGTYDLKPGATLQDLAQQGGKFASTADLSAIEIKRADGKVLKVNLLDPVKGPEALRTPLAPGDEVSVPQVKDKVLVVGPIQQPGYRPLKEGQTIREFLNDPDSGAYELYDKSRVNYKNVRILRPGEDEAIKINLNDAINKKQSKHNIELKSGDTLLFEPRDPGEGRPGGVLGMLQYLSPLSWLLPRFF
ncbi:MAG: SLBB domain-containing protein [Armatimonadota bacterium]